MNQSDRLVQIYHRESKYQIHLPAPPTLAHALTHLSQLEPHVRANLVVVTLVAESIVPAEEALAKHDRDERTTEPAPPLPSESQQMKAVTEVSNGR